MFLERRFTFMSLLRTKYAQYDKLSKDRQFANQESANAKSKISPTPSQDYVASNPKPEAYHEPGIHLWLNFGLCVVVFVGLADILGIDLKTADASNLYVLVFIYIIAWILSLAIKKLMSYAAKLTFQFSRLIDEKKDVAFWINLLKGNPAFYLAIFLVVLECCFGLPGVLSTIPPLSEDNHLLVFAVVAGSCLCAVVNVALGYHTGITQGIAEAKIERWEQQLGEIKSSATELDCIRRNKIYQETLAKCEVTIADLKDQIAQLDYEIERLEWQERGNRHDRPEDSDRSTFARSTNPRPPSPSDFNGKAESSAEFQ
jgi:hypothetical protein